MTPKEKFLTLMFKKEFIDLLAKKINLDPRSVNVMIYNESFKKHSEVLNELLDLRMIEDEKIRQINVDFEKVNV